MRRVIVESPYAGDVDRNVRYARACLADCLRRGESPLASHLLYTQPGVLDDSDPEQRKLGFEAGFAWRSYAHATVVYLDLGISSGMRRGIEHAEAVVASWFVADGTAIDLNGNNVGHVIEYRRLGGEWEQG